MACTDRLAADLTALQRLLRKGERRGEESKFTGTIPRDLNESESPSLLLTERERGVLLAVQRSVEADLRFELLAASYGEPYRDALWRFACLCVLRPDEDHVVPFFTEHAREIEERTCYFAVEALTVKERVHLQGVRLLPTDAEEVPRPDHWFSLDSPVGSVIAVPVAGTNLKLMKERARPLAEHALRVARIALRENRFINAQQLRFRLSETYSFGPRLAGFDLHPDASLGLELDDELAALLETEPVAKLSAEPAHDLERRADRALRWLDQASLETEPVSAMLFCFFALEAMLGRRDHGLKARDLAFQRAMLSVAVNEHFAHPDRSYRLYDEVRNDAVHGGEPELSEEDYRNFTWDIRRALKEYLELAEREGFKTRKRLLRYLRKHPERSRLEKWLRENGDPDWDKYFPGRELNVGLSRVKRLIEGAVFAFRWPK
jgi:hypothetical protein